MNKKDLKILLLGVLLGIIMTFLVLKLINIPIIYDSDDIQYETYEDSLDTNDYFEIESSKSAEF